MIAAMALPFPDPRCFAPPSADPFVARALEEPADALQREQPSSALVQAYRDALDRNAEDDIRRSLRNATSAALARRLWLALDAALSPPASEPEALVLRVFALPVLLVTGGRPGARIPGVVPDVRRLQQVLEGGGALGPSRNLGFGNALCGLEALESIPYCRLHALQRDPGAGVTTPLGLPPLEVQTRTGDEEVHLRFLVGASVTPADAASFVETASAIGNWGMALTQELAEQLRTEQLSLLPIARPPASILLAQSIGSTAREELALQAFVSRTLRRFRAEIGEPESAVAALASGVLGVRFSSAFVEDRVSVHRRALHQTEDVNDAGRAAVALLEECGIAQVAVLPRVMDDATFARNPAAGVH
jgi:hypothetical protein